MIPLVARQLRDTQIFMMVGEVSQSEVLLSNQQVLAKEALNNSALARSPPSVRSEFRDAQIFG